MTPQGMRQRYLKGRHNRERYMVDYALLSPEYVPGEVYVQSTYKERTIQSAYSELMGLYTAEAIQEIKLENNDLPFKVRNYDVEYPSGFV